jgi:hypothetical protein
MYSSLMAEAAYKPDLVNEAGVTSAQQSENYRGQMQRNLARMGVNPNSGRFAGLSQKWSLQSAADKAGAMTRAARQEREGVFGKLLSSVGMGRDLLGSGASLVSQGSDMSGAGASGLMGVAGAYGDIAAGQAEEARLQAEANERNRGIAPLMPSADTSPVRNPGEYTPNNSGAEWYWRNFGGRHGYMAI